MASVLLCALASTGGARSFVSIAITLLGRGHRVTVISGREAERHFRHLPVEFVAVSEPSSTHARAAAAGMSRGQRTKQAFAHVRTQYAAPMPQQWAAVQRVVASAAVDVVLTENLFLGAMALIYLPREQRPFVVGIGTVPPIAPDPAVPPYGLGISPPEHAPGRLVTAAREVANSRAYVGAGTDFLDHVERFTGLRPHPDVRRVPMQQDVFAQLTVPRFEYPRTALPTNFRFIGPLRPVEQDEIPPWWDPQHEPPVVAVDAADGEDPADLVLPTIEGFGGENVTVLVAGVERATVEAAHGRPLPQNVHFDQDMPWSRLPFGRSVLVTAGDYIPTQYALRSGTPVVAAPDSSSRMETAARVEWSGAGINLRTASPDPARLRTAVLEALADMRIQRAVARIAAQIATSDAEGDLADIVEQESARRPGQPAKSSAIQSASQR